MIRSSDIKKRIIRGRQTGKYGPVDLYVNKADGEMWASNGYWVTRAERVAPLLSDYNLSADEPGWYLVGSTVTRSEKQAPEINKFLADNGRGFTLPSTRVQVAGKDAYVLNDNGEQMAVYQLPDSTMVGLLDSDIAWLSNSWDAPKPDRHRVDGVHTMFRRGEKGFIAAFIADMTHVIESHKYGTDPDTREQTSIPEVTEPAPPILLAIVAAANYSS